MPKVRENAVTKEITHKENKMTYTVEGFLMMWLCIIVACVVCITLDMERIVKEL